MENWTKLEISQIGKVVSGGTPDTNNSDFWDGNVNWCTPTDITALKTRFLGDTKRRLTEKGLKKSSATVLPIGSIIVCTRATIGECAINTVEMTTNQGFKTIIPKNNFNSDFIYYSIVLNKPELIRLSAGSTFGEVPKTAFEKLKLDVPPLAEQKKIAEILSTWDKSIETTEKLIAAKQKLKKSLMQRLLNGSQRFPEFHGQEWKVGKISDSCFVNQKTISEKTNSDYEFFYLDISCVDVGNIDFPKSKIRFADAPSRARRIAKKNDIVMSTVRPNLQSFAFIDNEIENLIASTGFAVITPNEKADARFIYHNIFSDSITQQLNALITGSNYPAINGSQVEHLKLPLPSLEEQKKIAAVLNVFDAEINVLQSKLAALRQQKRGLMQKLLTGKVRVKVEEN